MKTIRALFDEGKVPSGTVGMEKWRREYNESIVGDLDKLMADTGNTEQRSASPVFPQYII